MNLVDRGLMQPPPVVSKCTMLHREAAMDLRYHTGIKGVTGERTVVYKAEVIGAEVTKLRHLMHLTLAKGVTGASDEYRLKREQCGIAEGPVGSTCVSVAASGARRAVHLANMI